ncbi:ribosomal L7Ae/L30e/S12e/Gadd45 family protein [Lachnospira multipara]|jgi:ribosomal protein L7Ae-like RNA K-turn-binding protein|uniref:L7Ae/L30e/S12e/Gadd45 family ribosomal protein n=1 Tax=Lachnospira multipara TaxID=28051 RepID=UPI0004E1B92C
MNLENKKIISMLGLAQKAGKVVSGEFSTEKAVKQKKAFMVIVADDSSDNTKKMFSNMCEFYKVPIYFFSDKESVGHAIGKEFRASLAILDEGFSNKLKEYFAKGLDTNNKEVNN